jgi:hypothetical protein
MACQWYAACPLREFERQGRLDQKWAAEYCASEDNWKNCQRYQLEERGIPHPDDSLPDGSMLSQ